LNSYRLEVCLLCKRNKARNLEFAASLADEGTGVAFLPARS
jgi:hypothetical protein